jgi:hypothetical protein
VNKNRGHIVGAANHGPEAFDPDQASAARMYDYYLGGSHNFVADREAAARVMERLPDIPLMAQANRAFLHRAVRYLLEQGIRQFIDLGSGIPTAGNVHEVAPEAHVVYVDIDPVAVAYSETILTAAPRATIVHADIRDPRQVLESPITRGLIDFDQPVALLMVAIMHFVSDADDPGGLVAAFRDAVPAGSAIALAHGTFDERPHEITRLAEIYQNSANPTTFRTRAQIQQFLDGWELSEPGLTWVVDWRPDWPDENEGSAAWCSNYGAVGWKR